MSTWTLVRRNLGRNRVRTLLTTLAVAFAIFLVCAVMTLPSVRDAILSRSLSGLRLIVHHKYGMSFSNLPLAHAQKIRGLPHVAALTHWTWFGGVYTEPKDFFPNYAVDAETFADTSTEIEVQLDPTVLQKFRQTRDGALVGVRTMNKFGWKIGDEVTLRDSPWYGMSLTFKIVGQIPEVNDLFSTLFLFQRQYFEEAMTARGDSGWVSMLIARVDKPEHVTAVMTAIDDEFRNSAFPTATDTERAFIANFLNAFASIIQIVMLVGFLVVAAIVLIAANTTAMSVRERVNEVAVLKTIGFRRRMVFSLLLGEAVLMAGVGGTLGAGLAYVVLNAGKQTWAPFLGPLAMFIMPVSVLIQGLFLALTVGIVAGVIPARGAARLNVATALRQIA